MKVGVIGYGSIGQRHVQNLLQLGISDIKLLRVKGQGNIHGLEEFHSVADFFSKTYDFIIIATPTSEHFNYLARAIDHRVNFLCEKPLVSSTEQLTELEKSLVKYRLFGAVAMNMRFHPCIISLKSLLQEGIIGDIYSARFFVGQYLPDWRPTQDYTKSYSAKRQLGGGVTLDLIHEIDLATDLFGIPDGKLVSLSGKFSELAIDTEDITEILYITQRKSLISLHLDYVFRGYKREFLVIGEKGNIAVDLFRNTLLVHSFDGSIVTSQDFADFNKNEMYLHLLKVYINDLLNSTSLAPSISDGLMCNRIALKVLTENGIK